MTASLAVFQANIRRAKTLCGLAEYLERSVTFDVSDIYRAVLVLAVSSLDSYVHEVVAERILVVVGDKSKQTDAFLKFQVSMAWVQLALDNPSDTSWIVAAVRERHSFLSFQQPDNIADAIRLVANEPLWPFIANALGEDIIDLKQRLRVVVDRRNKIAHEADIDPLTRQTWPVDSNLVTSATEFIESLVSTIDKIFT